MENIKIYCSKNAVLLQLVFALVLGIPAIIIVVILIIIDKSVTYYEKSFVLMVVLFFCILFAQYVIKLFRINNFKKPMIIIEQDRILLYNLTFFLRLTKTIIDYNSIVSLQTRYDVDKEYGFMKKYLIIELKSKKLVKFSFKSFDETHLEILNKIRVMNPSINIMDKGVIET
jgi:hypothetical protein